MIPQRIKARLKFVYIATRTPPAGLPDCNSHCDFYYKDKLHEFECNAEFLKKHFVTLIDNIGKEIEIEFLSHTDDELLKNTLQITNILI